MLREGLARYAAAAVHTPFVGDRADDLKPAFHAGRQRYGCVQGLAPKLSPRVRVRASSAD